MNPVSEGKLAFTVVDPEMLVESDIYETVIPFPSVRIENGILQTDFPLDDRTERRSFAVRDDFRVDFNFPILILSLYQAEHRLL